MTKQHSSNTNPTWVTGKLTLADTLDNRIIGLLTAIQQTGSLNQAAKQQGLSYKGAWQILERANNSAPQLLVSTAIGGSKGGGSRLTEAGLALLNLFSQLEQQHQQFLAQLNCTLFANPETVLLLQRLSVKTNVRNQLFGRVIAIQTGELNANVIVALKGGEQIIVSVEMATLTELDLVIGVDALLLINSSDVMLMTEADTTQFSVRNRLFGRVFRIQQDTVNAEVMVLLPSGEVLVALITQQSEQNLALASNTPVYLMFKANAPILGVLS